jgi:signal transduction histidine kinase
MRFRVEALGGEWRLDTAPGRGTRIVARLPA